jgi:hypothetical protein
MPAQDLPDALRGKASMKSTDFGVLKPAIRSRVKLMMFDGAISRDARQIRRCAERHNRARRRANGKKWQPFLCAVRNLSAPVPAVPRIKRFMALKASIKKARPVPYPKLSGTSGSQED